MGTWNSQHRSLGAVCAAVWMPALCLAASMLIAAPAVTPSAAWAAESDGSVDEAESALATADSVLGLDEALAQSYAGSPSVRLAELDLKDARISYKQAKAQNLLQGSSIALATAESAWRVAQRNHEIALQELKGQVEEAYYGVLRAQYALELSEKGLTTAERQLDVTEAELQQGMVSQVDLLTAKSERATAEATLAQAQADLASSRMRFNVTVGREIQAPLQLVDEFTYEPASLELGTFVDAALTGRVELLQARDTLDRSQKELETKQNDYTPELEKEKARNALERAKVKLQQQEAQIKVDVRQKFQTVEAARTTIELREQSEAIAHEQLRIAKLQRDAGILTDLGVLDAARAYQKAQTDSLQAVFDYNIALLDLYRAAGMERP